MYIYQTKKVSLIVDCTKMKEGFQNRSLKKTETQCLETNT